MLSILYLAVPTVLAALSICRLRGVWRAGAIGCLFIVLPAFVRDMIGVAHGGNLAGIYTLMLMKPMLLFLLVLHGTSRSPVMTKRIGIVLLIVGIATFIVSGMLMVRFRAAGVHQALSGSIVPDTPRTTELFDKTSSAGKGSRGNCNGCQLRK